MKGGDERCETGGTTQPSVLRFAGTLEKNRTIKSRVRGNLHEGHYKKSARDTSLLTKESMKGFKAKKERKKNDG